MAKRVDALPEEPTRRSQASTLGKAASVAPNALRWLLQTPHVYAAQTYITWKQKTLQIVVLNKTGTNFLHTRFVNVLIILEPNTLC